MRTLIAGGGTGGHLTPALAVAQALRRRDPEGRVLLVTRHDPIASELVHDSGIPTATIPISGLDLGDVRSAVGFAVRLPGAVVRALALIRRFHPDVVVGSAGYVSVPVVIAARLMRKPVILMEQNALPGRATRLLARRAAVVASSFAQTGRHLPSRLVIHTGNPIRAEIAGMTPAALGDRCRQVLIMGGSQGARRLNEAVMAGLRSLLDDPELEVVHQTGSLDINRVRRFRAALPEALQRRYEVAAFFSDIAAREARADLLVMRAGGSSLAEVTAMGRPMVLVPYAHAAGHQDHNAAAFVAAGAAVVVPDAEFSGVRLVSEVRAVVADPQRWRSMGGAAASLGRPDAADRVADVIAEVATSGTVHGARA